jgi:hypothetical protein
LDVQRFGKDYQENGKYDEPEESVEGKSNRVLEEESNDFTNPFPLAHVRLKVYLEQIPFR